MEHIEKRFDTTATLDDRGKWGFTHRGEKWYVWSESDGWHVNRKNIDPKGTIEDLCGAIERVINEVEGIRDEVEQQVGPVDQVGWRYGSGSGVVRTERGITVRGWESDGLKWKALTKGPEGEYVYGSGRTIKGAFEDLKGSVEDHVDNKKEQFEEWAEGI